MKSLKIAIDINAFYDGNSGGIPTYLTNIMQQLQRIDQKNEYFLFEIKPSNFPLYNPKWKTIVYKTKLFNTLWLQLIFPFYLLKYKIDVFWTPNYICPLFSFKKIRKYITVHDLTFIHFPKTMRFKDAQINKIFIPWSAYKADLVFTDSDFIKKDIEKNMKNLKTPVLTIYAGKPQWLVPGTYSPVKRKGFLFFAGNLEPRKNLLSAIKALELLLQEGFSIEMHIVSPRRWKQNEFFSTLEKSPVRRNIKMLGYLEVEKLQEQYLTCKALLYPSLYEGFGLPVVEALSLDCLVLTSKNTVMQEIAGPAALYFDPLDPHDIASVIKNIYSKEFDRMHVLKHKDDILKNYSWEIAARTMLSVFETGKEKEK